MGVRWRRKLRFVIPVRRPDLWSSHPVLSALVETISFLSDDDYEFEFHIFENPPAPEVYFPFSGAKDVRFTPDEVILFSAVWIRLLERSRNWCRKKVALVSHRSATKILKSDEFSFVFLRRLRFGDGRRPIAL
jgi:hypothetical protein